MDNTSSFRGLWNDEIANNLNEGIVALHVVSKS